MKTDRPGRIGIKKQVKYDIIGLTNVNLKTIKL